MSQPNDNQLAIFEQKHIRSVQHEGETWFSVIDIVEILTDSKDPRGYWKVLKGREPQLVTICYQLKMPASDGKMRATDCANTEGVLRIIQSVPSPKAEPFKMWLAQAGKEKIEETADPELSIDRQIEGYRAKGYSEKWITRRMQTIRTRNALTNEWKNRGIEDSQDYQRLTATIATQTFGVTPSEHSKLKNLEGQNLRDHMTEFELIFTALGEEATRSLTVDRDAQGYNDNHDAATDGGRMAGNARRNFEKELGKPVVSSQNFLQESPKTEELPPTE
jgi:DNA-damage-inducible protein D